MEDLCIIPVIVAIFQGLDTITDTARMYLAMVITMGKARMHRVTATIMVKVDMLLDTAIITVIAATIRAMVIIMDMERCIDREVGIMGSAHGSFLCCG